jgi:formylglycine-generating enzyme required for sulfatase activity
VADRLTALQDLEDLLEEADERLWPPYPDKIERYRSWIAAAEALVAALPGYRARREEYRARALPRSDEERRRERETHPHLLRLISLQRELAAKRAALLQRRDGVSVELPALDWSAQPQSREALVSRAWALMHPDRLVHGREAEALVLARRALELSGDEPEHRAPSHHTLAWAQLSLGRDEAARAAAAAALEAAPAEARESWERNVAALRAAVEQASSTEGLLAAEREVARLERAVAVLEARIDWRSGWRFPPEQAEARWWNANLTLLIDGLVELAQEDAGLLSPAGVSPEHGWSIPRRLAFARKLEAGFAEGGCHAAAWRAALPAIRAAYPGLDLGVQMGLVPLGPDPDSGLWEFAHLVSGAPAERAGDERLVLTEEMGVVLVLLPGGVFRMGAQSTDPAGPNHDPDATDAETPVHEVELSPFFLSKYEMTRGQWSRSTGSDPSYAALSLSEDAQRQPVRNVSWRMCTDLLPRCDLLLPSEAQWEYATRAGTDTAYPTGSEPRSLWVRPAGNLTREAALESGADPELADDFPVYAPVGAFAPNAFGLHDMIGNVAELCLDGYDPRFYAMSPRTDPVAPWAAAQTTVARGGAYLSGARAARSSWRTHHHLDYLHSAFGVRPARAVER